MRRKRDTQKSKMLIALASAFLLIVSFVQPVSQVAAEENFKLWLTEAVTTSVAGPGSTADTKTASMVRGHRGDASKMAQTVDVNICAVLLGNNLIDVNGNVVVDAGSLLTSLTRLVNSGELDLNLLNLTGFVGVLLDGGCRTQAPAPAEPTAPAPPAPVEPTAPAPPAPVEPTAPAPPAPAEPTAPAPPAPAEPTAPAPPAPAEPTAPAPPADGTDTVNPPADEKDPVNPPTNGSEPVDQGDGGPVARQAVSVVDLEICAVLLGENIIDLDGNLDVELDALPMILARLILSGQLDLGDIASLDAFIQLLIDGGCADVVPPADATDADATDADATDADATDADATDADATDADTSDADATDADTTDADAADSTDGEEPPVVDLEVCAVLLVNNILDLDGNLAVDSAQLPQLLGDLILSDDLALGDIASIDVLIGLLEGGDCAVPTDTDADAADADAADADATDADATDADAADVDAADADAADSTDGQEPPVIDIEICAVLLDYDIIDVDGNILVSLGTLPLVLAGLLTVGELELGDIADVDALIMLLQGGGCATEADATDADATDADATDADATDADATDADSTDADATDADSTDADATDADATDADATDSTDGEEPPLVDLEICTVLLGENIIDSEGSLIVDVSGLPLILLALIGSGDLDLGAIANVEALIRLLQNGGCANVSDATDADATDADATDGDATDADAADADATDADATDADATDADATDADATDADATDADTTDTDATDADATDADATDADATDADATDSDATDADATDADATDADATDADATDSDATDADATDADTTDADATDADATDVDSTDADATDADATDADATDADGDDGSDDATGTIVTRAYECATIGDTNLEYKNSTDPAAGTSGCEPGVATLTLTSVETGEAFVIVTGLGAASAGMNMPLMQVADPVTTTINGSGTIELPVGAYNVALDGTDVNLAIEVAEGDSNPSLVVSLLASSQTEPTATVAPGGNANQTPASGVTGLPSTGSGSSMSQFVWPLAAAGSVLLMLAGHHVLSTAKREK